MIFHTYRIYISSLEHIYWDLTTHKIYVAAFISELLKQDNAMYPSIYFTIFMWVKEIYIYFYLKMTWRLLMGMDHLYVQLCLSVCGSQMESQKLLVRFWCCKNHTWYTQWADKDKLTPSFLPPLKVNSAIKALIMEEVKIIRKKGDRRNTLHLFVKVYFWNIVETTLLSWNL